MDRRKVLGLALTLISTIPRKAQSQAVGIRSQPSTEFLRDKLVTSTKPDDASMDEISARLAWVLSGEPLPEEARIRTLARATSEKADKIGPIGFREDVSVTKRSLCFAILNLDEKLRG